MAIISEQAYIANGTQREFQVVGKILSDSHIGVWIVDYSTEPITETRLPTAEYDVLGSTVLLDEPPLDGLTVSILVSDNGEGLEQPPSTWTAISANIHDIIAIANDFDIVLKVSENIETVEFVADNMLDINTVSSNMTAIQNVHSKTDEILNVELNLGIIEIVSNNINDVKATSQNIVNVNKVANIDTDVTKVANNEDDISTVADNIDDVNSIVDTVVPNMTEILESPTNANIATQQANQSQLRAWEAEANRMTADSYATEPEDVEVKIYSSNGNGTFSYVNNGEYSALHYKIKAQDYVEVGLINDDSPYSDKVYSSNKTEELLGYKLDTDANAVSATKLKNSRTINGTRFDGVTDIVTDFWGEERDLQVNLSSNKPATIDGSDDELGIGVSGILGIVHGGTGVGTPRNIITDWVQGVSYKKGQTVRYYNILWTADVENTDTNLDPTCGEWKRLLDCKSLAQNLGSSTEVPMSQSAVTEAIQELGTNAQVGTDVYSGAYGFSWDYSTDTYIRTGAKGYTAIQSKMRRCVVDPVTRQVNYYLHPDNSNFKEDGTPSVLTGADGDVMVEVPKYYVRVETVGNVDKISISLEPESGYVVHPAFTTYGIEKEYRYYPAYEGYNQGGSLRSISGVVPTKNQTIGTFRTQAKNRAGWHLLEYALLNAVKILCYVEFADFKVTNYIGNGNDTVSDYDGVTGQTNALGNHSSDNTYNNKMMSYRGIENFYANIWKFIDGVNIQNYKFFVNNNPDTFASDVFTGDYMEKGTTLAMSSSYIKRCAITIDGGFLPTVVGGSATTYYADGGWSDTGNRVYIHGGDAAHGSLAGAGAVAVNAASSGSSAYLGAGVSF